jgi:H+/Cl- antiporter ClcA
MAWLDKLHHPEDFIKSFLKWGVLGVLVGCIGGLLGAGFHHALHFVTHVRGEHNWLIFLLPVGGLLTVGIYKVFRLQKNRPDISALYTDSNPHLIKTNSRITY